MQNHMKTTDTSSEALKQEIATLKEQLAESERQLEEYQTIFELMPIMLWYKDKENNLININKAAAELEGEPIEKLRGKNAYELYPQEQAKAFHDDDLEVINSGEPKLNIIEEHNRVVTGQMMYLQTGKVPYRNKDGEVIGVIALAVDITEQKEAEREVREAHKRLEHQNVRLERIHLFFLSTLEQMTTAIQRGATSAELLNYVRQAKVQFEQMR